MLKPLSRSGSRDLASCETGGKNVPKGDTTDAGETIEISLNTGESRGRKHCG